MLTHANKDSRAVSEISLHRDKASGECALAKATLHRPLQGFSERNNQRVDSVSLCAAATIKRTFDSQQITKLWIYTV